MNRNIHKTNKNKTKFLYTELILVFLKIRFGNLIKVTKLW